MNDFKQEIEDLIKGRVLKYKTADNKVDDIDEIQATYNREQETTNGYNGRQLLELLQNADDAKSTEILIKLNTEKHSLIIANKGKECQGFSVAGVKSLLLANLSSKTSNEYIGNKGLGFRSIINWSDKITINSNNLDISFSKNIACEKFKNIACEKLDLPILAIPQIEENPQVKWTTRISIIYKETFLKDIEEQINQLMPEILLFLNHLKTITIDCDGDKQVLENSIKKWEIKSKQGVFPSELLEEDDKDTKYELKIAYNLDGLNNNGIEHLFSYFPTNIKISMPFIVHGTFDLDATRNQLNNTKKNKHVLEQLVALIIDTAKELTKSGVSYKALEFLNYSHKNEVLEKLGFCKAIDSAIEKLEIYPCLDGQYKKKDDILYCNNFSKFIKSKDYCDIFPYLLIPVSDEQITNILVTQELDDFSYFNNQSEDLKMLNEKISNIDDRVEFIYLLIENNFEGKLSLLTDDDNQLIIDEEVYTPSNTEFSLPDFVKIKFINQMLFDGLVKKFEIESDGARELQRKLKAITDIHSYEPAPVLQKIITQSNRGVENDPEKAQEIIIKMVQALYKNYQKLGGFNISTDTKIQLLNKNQALSDANNLYLSKTYPSGKLTEFLFADVFDESEFLADVSVFELSFNGENSIEAFFIALGVSKNTKPKKVEDTRKYEIFVFQKVDKPVNLRDTQLTVTEIVNFEKIIKNLSLEKIVLWILSNKNIHKQLNDNNSDSFRYALGGEGHGYYQHTLYTKPSYIKYQFIKSKIFDNYLLKNDNLNALINNKIFDSDSEIFTQFGEGFNKSEIESVMLKIGATDKFNDLSIDAVSRIIQELPDESQNGKQSQSIYKLCIKHFEKNGKKLEISDYQLFAKKNGVDSYYAYKDVFYSGKKLPKKITESKAILNYPRRQNTTNIIDFFGIENLDKTEIKDIKNNELNNHTKEFEQLFDNIKPYILAHRINGIEADDGKKSELNKLKNIDIRVCSEVEYKINDEWHSLESNDYIRHTDGYYLLNIDSNTSLEAVKKTFEFQESFADIIGLAFDISEVTVFRNMLDKDAGYIEKTIQTDMGNDLIIEAKELLGISDEFNSFWRAVYQLKDLEYSDKLKEDFTHIQSKLGFSDNCESIDYADLPSIKTCKNVISLFQELGISVQDFNEKAYYKIDFSQYHLEKLENYFNDKHNNFEQCLHKNCIDQSDEEHYLSKLNQYNSKNIKKDFKDALTVDCQKECQRFVVDKFGFKLQDNIENIDIYSIHIENKKIFNNQCLPDGIESLLYFEDSKSKEKIQTHIDDQEKQDIPEEAQIKKSPPIVEKTLLSIQSTIPNNNHQISGRYNLNQDRTNKEKGDASEQLVYNSLVKEFDPENVIWESQKDDAAGYDIKYKNKENVWKYVEVKTRSNGVFYLSKNEKDFADSHKENYELYLVSSKEIAVIKSVDFLTLDLVAIEFKIHYKLKEQMH